MPSPRASLSLLAIAISVNLAGGIAALVAGHPRAEAAEDHIVQAAADVTSAVLVELGPASPVEVPSTPATTTTTTAAPPAPPTTLPAVPAAPTTTTAPAASARVVPGPTATTVAPAPTTTSPPPTTPAPSTTAGRDQACEAAMLGWMNEARAGRGVSPLTEDEAIQHVSVDWSTSMAERGTLEHNPDYGPQIFSVRPEARRASENVGRSAAGSRLVFDEFMRSPSHEAHIVNAENTHTTVGCIQSADGQLWVTVNFWG